MSYSKKHLTEAIDIIKKIDSENIENIRTIKDGTYPMNNADEFMIIQQALQGE